MKKQPLTPLKPNERIVIVDILRGWALIGVVIVNYYLFFYLWAEASIPKDDYLSDLYSLDLGADINP